MCVCVCTSYLSFYIYIYINKQLFTWYNESHGALKGVCVCVCVLEERFLSSQLGLFLTHQLHLDYCWTSFFFFLRLDALNLSLGCIKTQGWFVGFFWRAEFSPSPPQWEEKKASMVRWGFFFPPSSRLVQATCCLRAAMRTFLGGSSCCFLLCGNL